MMKPMLRSGFGDHQTWRLVSESDECSFSVRLGVWHEGCPRKEGPTVLTLTDFLTVTGAAVFVGGVLKGPITARGDSLLLSVSGMVVAATALGSHTGVVKWLEKM